MTDADVNYIGSITIDRDLIEQVGLEINELVHVWNVDNGQRFETYVIEGPPGSGVICVNGAAAHLTKTGDVIIIAAWGFVDAETAGAGVPPPVLVRVDGANRPLPDAGPERHA